MSDTSLPVYFHYGTAAQRAAFTPVPPATGQPIYIWYESDNPDDFYIYTTAWKGPYQTGGGTSQDYLQYRDEKAQNTGGGTFTSGAWQTRTLNTEVTDVGGFGTLASNQITLSAGTYRIAASAPSWRVNRNQLRLQNVTDATTVLIGMSSYDNDTGSDGSATPATLNGIFTVAASKALELQHQCQTTIATSGFGVAANFTTEVYAVVELWKIG